MANRVRVINEYFRELDAYSHVPYVPFGADLVDVAMNHTGRRHLWVSTAATVVEMESGGKNVFGCDAGSWYCNRLVDAARVRSLIEGFKRGECYMNGVGLTQITWYPYVAQAQRMPGGAANMRNQMIVGFNVLNDLLNAWPYHTALEAYNDGHPQWNDPANPYDQKFAGLHQQWKERLM